MTTNSSIPSIKTDIFEFCQAFVGILKPFAASLEAARADIQGKGDAEALQRPMAGFSDVHHRLESLVNKVEEQQAYLIIFGPLKSGKSTLMNAISAAYVSEVTSLPAYPCLVHVKHGDEYSFVASRYNGEKLRFSDNAALQSVIKQSHETLAERLREVEEQGEKFDPGVHYPEAIRRVDVTLPARNLKDSLTVLVDTPGLYTRMKFGYDLMTREFRNSAACAVFVVKTDNLFLEQVFEEFNQLLDLFSRIFIVVNIDANKRDLEPDGSLCPSLESKSPGEVIRAFESLVMSAPLRRAQQQGRLKIYPIDLLNSASAAMRQTVEIPPAAAAVPDADSAPAVAIIDTGEPAGDADAMPPPPAGSPSADDLAPAAELSAPPPAPCDGKVSVMPASWSANPEASFTVFLKDLTDYLNSSDYLQEFMGDALLMGSNLGMEIQDHCSRKSTAALETCQTVLATELAETETRLAEVEQFAALDIPASFAPVREESDKYASEVSKAAVADTQKKALMRLEDWFESNESVAALQADWAALIAACGQRVGSECQDKLRSVAASTLGGIQPGSSLRSAMVGLDSLLSPALTAARATLGENPPAAQAVPFRIEPEQLHVHKSLWDWLAFRSLAAVRRGIFGRPEAMDREVPALLKEKRLGAEGRVALQEWITSHLAQRFPSEALAVSQAQLGNYIATLAKEMQGQLRAGKDKFATRKTELTQRIEDNRKILQSLDELTGGAADVLDGIDKLRRKYRSYSRVTGAVPAMTAVDDDAADQDPAGEITAAADPLPATDPYDEPEDEMPEDCQATDEPARDDAILRDPV